MGRTLNRRPECNFLLYHDSQQNCAAALSAGVSRYRRRTDGWMEWWDFYAQINIQMLQFHPSPFQHKLAEIIYDNRNITIWFPRRLWRTTLVTNLQENVLFKLSLGQQRRPGWPWQPTTGRHSLQQSPPVPRLHSLQGIAAPLSHMEPQVRTPSTAPLEAVECSAAILSLHEKYLLTLISVKLIITDQKRPIVILCKTQAAIS